jgi:hypothetical protein
MRVGVPPAVYMPHQFNGMHVAQTAWSYPVEFVPPPQLLLPNPVVSPAASSPDSFDFATPSSSPTSSDRSDDGILPAVDDVPGQHYPSYFPAEPQHGGVPYGYDDPFLPYSQARMPLTVVPAAYGMAPLYDIFSPKTPPSAGFYASAGFLPQPQSPRSPIDRDRQRIANYRSKYYPSS